MADVRRWIQDLDDYSSKVRYDAASALRDLSKRELKSVEPAIPKLIECLSDPTEAVREIAAEALGNIGAVQALEPLNRLTADETAFAAGIGEVAQAAVNKIKRKNFPLLLREINIQVPESIGYGEGGAISIEVTNPLSVIVKELSFDFSQSEPYLQLSQKIVNFPSLGKGGRLKKRVQIKPSLEFLGELAFEVKINSSVGEGSKSVRVNVVEKKKERRKRKRRKEVTVVSPLLRAKPAHEGDWANYELMDTTPYAIGGFADIFRARDRRSGEMVATKMPRVVKEDDMWRTLDKGVFDEFLGEAEKWSRLEHPNIVVLKDFGSKPLPWLAMEFAPEGSLGKRLSEARLSVEEVVRIALKLCDALHYAHNLGVVHLDIKPRNILFIDAEPKLTDWGTAKTLLYEKVTRSRFTPEYAAPEQLDPGYGEPDRRTDVYQLGVVIYEMLTGRVPFASDSPALLMKQILQKPPEEPSKANPEVPEELDKIVLKCLEKRKEDRYEVVWLLKEDLKKLR